MKQICFLPVFLLLGTQAFSQNFPGFRSGNFTGVNGVFSNPANIADSRYRFDINLVSVSTFVGNNQATFRLKNISKTFNEDSLKNQVTGKNAGATSGLLEAAVVGPSVMFNIGKKSAVAITTRVRAMINISDMDGKPINQVSDDANNANLPYSISSGNNMRLAINGWAEYGASYARIFYDEGPHFIKGGVTLKYLSGAGNAFININNFKATIDDETANEPYLGNSTGRIGVAFGGGATISDFEASDLTKKESSGFGGDIGFVYEYRPEDGRSSMKGINKYLFKAAISLLDVGAIKYEKDMTKSSTYDINITGAERFYLKQLTNAEIDGYNSVFKSYPQYFTPANTNNESSYSVSLPTTLNLDVDYHLHRGFYVNLLSALPLAKSSGKPYNSGYYSTFMLTPRYEGRAIGAYLPLTYNRLTKFNAGLSLRFGPLFFGSGSVVTALLKDSKQADVFLGLRFGSLQKSN